MSEYFICIFEPGLLPGAKQIKIEERKEGGRKGGNDGREGWRTGRGRERGRNE